MFNLVWKAGKALWPEVRMLPLRAAVALGSAGLGERPRPARLWKAYGIVLPIGLAACCLLPSITLVASPSIDAFVLRAAPGTVARGDLVSFALSHPLAGPYAVDVTKYALCLPGDRIAMIERTSPMRPGARDGWYYCNGRLLGASKPVGSHGQILTHWQPAYAVIPEGLIYVGSAHPGGFDSRYYGPVAITRLRRMEKLL